MWLNHSKTALSVFQVIGILAMNAGLAAYPALAAEKSDGGKAESGLTVAEFEQLHKKLTTMSTQKVWSIPWKLSVREARELAAKENKPVFLWISSNGGTHPLGPC